MEGERGMREKKISWNSSEGNCAAERYVGRVNEIRGF